MNSRQRSAVTERDVQPIIGHDEGARAALEQTWRKDQAAGRTPSVIRVSLPAGVVGQEAVRQCAALLERFRPLLPDDCVALAVTAGSFDLVSTAIVDPVALGSLCRQLRGSVQSRPVHAAGRERDIHVRACFADDGCGYRRASDILSCCPARSLGPTWPVVRASHQGTAEPQISSQLGLSERDLPALRRQHPEGSLTLAALLPVGAAWQRNQQEGTSFYVATQIYSQVEEFAQARQGVLVELAAGASFPLAIVLPTRPDSARAELAALVAELQEQSYAYFSCDFWEPIAERGEISLRLAVREVSGHSDAAAELAGLREELPAAPADLQPRRLRLPVNGPV